MLGTSGGLCVRCLAVLARHCEKNAVLTFDPLQTTPETTSETTQGPSPDALGPLRGPRVQVQRPFALGATGKGPRASGEDPRVVSGVVSGAVSRGSDVRNSLLGSAGPAHDDVPRAVRRTAGRAMSARRGTPLNATWRLRPRLWNAATWQALLVQLVPSTSSTEY